MKKICFLLCIIFYLAACNKDIHAPFDQPNSITNAGGTDHTIIHTEGATVLGEAIDIPYSMDNLKKAYALLPESTKSILDFTLINPTHYYVRFTPKNIEELDILRNINPRLILSETPLDREVVISGTFYHDPDLPDGIPTYQYSTIPIDTYNALRDTLSVESEILLEAYIPDYDDIISTKVLPEQISVDTYTLLLKKAYEITGNEYKEIVSTKGSEWHPEGTIKAYDNKYGGLIPVPGVRVRATHLLKVHEALTDTDGHYRLKSFKNPVNMKVVWESDDWDIRTDNIGQATYDGPKISSGYWNLNADNSYPKTIRYAAIHRAAYRYYYGNNCELSRPDNSRKEKIGYFHSELDGINGDYNRQLGASIWTDIRIAGKNSSGLREPSEIFSTTCHELGHASHYTNAKNMFSKSTDSLIESWARFVQYILTIQEYRELGVEASLFSFPAISYSLLYKPDNQYNFQYRSNSDSDSDYYNTYTPFFIDLYDDYNQIEWPDFSLYPQYHPNDEISGVPPSILESLAFASKNFSDVLHHLYYSNSYSNDFYNEHNINGSSIADLIIVYQ